MAKYGSDMLESLRCRLPLFQPPPDITFIIEMGQTLSEAIMPSSSTSTRAATGNASQPSFWKHYSPRGECPISFAGSVLLHALVPLAIVLLVVWGPGRDSENSKPPQMDVVEIEGGGGGLGGNSVGPGKLDSGKPGRSEVASNTVAPQSAPNVKIDDIKMKDLPTLDIAMPTWEDSKEAKD